MCNIATAVCPLRGAVVENDRGVANEQNKRATNGRPYESTLNNHIITDRGGEYLLGTSLPHGYLQDQAFS